MDSVGKTIDIPYQLIITIILIAIIVGCIVRFMYFTPKFKRVDEGFFGGVSRGSGHPDSSRVLPESAELLEAVSAASSSDDYKELELILSKMASLKKTKLMAFPGYYPLCLAKYSLNFLGRASRSSIFMYFPCALL